MRGAFSQVEEQRTQRRFSLRAPEKLQQLLHDARDPLGMVDQLRETLGILEGLVAARRGDTHELEIPPTFGPDD